MIRATSDLSEQREISSDAAKVGLHVFEYGGTDYVCNDANGFQIDLVQVGDRAPLISVVLLRAPGFLRRGMALSATLDVETARDAAATLTQLCDELEATAATQAAAALAKAAGK